MVLLPKDTNNKILAIIYSDEGKFLLLRTNKKHMGMDAWYVVTGAIKKGESSDDAAMREVIEETKLKVLEIKPTEHFFEYEWPVGSGIMKREDIFLAKVKHDKPKITAWEHIDYKWLNKKDFIDQIYWYNENREVLKEILAV